MPSSTERVGPPSSQPPSTQPVSSGSDADGTTSKLSVIQTEKETVREPCRASEQPTQLEEFDQCGLEDDGIEWTEWDGPKRIKETRATNEEQIKYRKILDRCFSPIAVMGVRALFHPDEVLDVMVKAQKYLESEPVLIEDVPFGVTIVGDIHGQLHDLYRVFRAHGTNKGKQSIEGFESSKFLFLGDYVDRGRQSLEVVMALFTLKILYPDNFFLLRGNHEFITVNITNGFSKEMRQRYDKETAEALFYQINDAFNYLSIAAIVGNSYFCVHAGISPMGFTRNQLRGLTKPFIFADEDILVNDMVWADPAVGLRGTVFNTERRTSIFFGMDALVTALTSVDCVALFRGHDMMKDGFDNQMNICFTVFTATAVYEGDNNGACVAVDSEGRLTVIRLVVDNERADRDKRLFPVDEDVKTVCERTTGELATIGS
uniref:Serine/threonine-protein phosphatase n=1 Tax=Pristionchus pacificus TaxID=54126 RepID=A0A8R1Z2T2_PRIPA